MRRRRRLAGFLAACAAALGLQAAPAHADELADLVDPQAHFEKIAYGFRYVEGPVWDPRGWLLFSDIPANTVYQCAPRIWTLLSLEVWHRELVKKTCDGDPSARTHVKSASESF